MNFPKQQNGCKKVIHLKALDVLGMTFGVLFKAIRMIASCAK